MKTLVAALLLCTGLAAQTAVATEIPRSVTGEGACGILPAFLNGRPSMDIADTPAGTPLTFMVTTDDSTMGITWPTPTYPSTILIAFNAGFVLPETFGWEWPSLLTNPTGTTLCRLSVVPVVDVPFLMPYTPGKIGVGIPGPVVPNQIGFEFWCQWAGFQTPCCNDPRMILSDIYHVQVMP
jgi:hypothetical protein